jgi:TM2 domain-containing membrane protein YozV
VSGATFGRKGAGPDATLAARRAAFLAEERARALQPARGEDYRPPATPVFVREKSLGTAYLLWFFLGGLSAHRFYLGFAASGAIQVGLVMLGYGLIFSKSPAGLIFLLGWSLWLLADAVLILAMHRKANERVRRGALGPVFA